MPEISQEEYSALMRTQARFGQLRTQYRTLRASYDQLEASHGEMSGALEGVITERDELRSAPQASADDRVRELTGKLRDVTHRQAFAKVAEAKGIRPDAIADAYGLSGYKPEADEPDPAALETLVSGLVGSRAYLLKSAEAEKPAAEPSKPGAPSKTVPAPGQLPADTAGARGGSAAPQATETAAKVAADFAASGRTNPFRI